MKLLRALALSTCLLMSLGCGETAPEPNTPARLPDTLTTTQVRLDACRAGVLAQRRGVPEFKLAPAEPTKDVRKLRTTSAPARLTLLSGKTEIGRLWLDAKSSVELAGDENGELVVELKKGRARVKLFRDQRAQWLHQGELHVAEGDRLVSSEGLVPTRRAPKMAEWTHTVVAPSEPPALGELRASSPGGGDAPLHLTKVEVRGTLVGKQVLVELEHHFLSETAGMTEGVFRFPLPPRAALVGLAMDVNGKMMEGELVEKHKARQTYENIVDSMRDPALLEWEPGNVFKLRVFPLLPGETKRVLVRYLAPLSDDGTLSLSLATPALQARPPVLSALLDGKRLKLDASEPTVTFATKRLPSTTQSKKNDRVYTHLTFITPKLEAEPEVHAPGRDILLLLDTSRSALETASLTEDAINGIVSSLTPDDRIKVARTDLTVEELTPLWSSSAVASRLVSQALTDLHYDGASDLGAALKYAAHQKSARGGRRGTFEVIYLGDATATWGETRPEQLTKLARSIGSPVHSLSLEKKAATSLLALISAQTGGKTLVPSAPGEVHAFGAELESRATSPLLTDVRVRTDKGHELYPARPQSLATGDALDIVIRSPAFKKPPSHVLVEGKLGDKTVSHRVSLKGAVFAPLVHKRFYQEHLTHLTQSGAEPALITKTSLEHGIMSRHTAFLVLESEEAYKRFNIERKKKETLTAPRVSGGDLESVSARNASLSPNRLQPGDPEVRVPAPRKAQSVRVIFPFGDVKEATYEEDLQAWTVRFLVAESTADGVYPVKVRVQHEDDRVEFLDLSYVVDTRSPQLKFSLKNSKRGVIITAKQTATADELALCAAQGSANSESELFHRYGKDAKRAELRLASGRIVPMTAVLLGEFRATLDARTIDEPFSILVWDKAGNLRETQLARGPSNTVKVLSAQNVSTGALQ